MVRTDRTPRRRLDPSERRERILAAATDAFAATPYDEVSVAAIAAQAEASEPLVYRYFTGKADLYAQIVTLAIADLLARTTAARHEFALWGFFGFLDAACLCWVERGCPDDERVALVDAGLGALEGALGDWAA